MADARMTPDVDLEGMDADEAFSVLGNETRLDIVRVLWHADAVHEYEDADDTARTMSFSELRHAVDVEDNGRFNYHLSQLTPHFVRGTEEGYRLSGAGKRIARTVIAVSGPDSVDFSTDLDQQCPLCGAPMAATYEDQWLRVRCTDCDGLFGDETPDGMVYFSNYPAAGLTDRSPDEALSTGLFRCLLDQAYLMHGVCRACAGRVSATVSVCPDHDGPDCGTCGTAFPAWSEHRCETCGFAKRLPVELFAMGLTPVVGFLERQGFDVFAPSFEELVDVLETRFETTVDRDPTRVTVTVTGTDERLSVTLDDDMDVREIQRDEP